MLDLPVLRLDPDLPLPAYARAGDAGIDLIARDDVTLAAAGGRALVATGIAIALPEGYAGFVHPRAAEREAFVERQLDAMPPEVAAAHRRRR